MLLLLLAFVAGAAEGYWRPDQVAKMKSELSELGIEVPAKELADPAGQVFGATVWLGNCTGSFVSNDGLILTNAHCIRSWLQQASNDDTGDLVLEGFVAASRDAELGAGPTTRVFVPLSNTDVTKEMLGSVAEGVDDAGRWRALQSKIVELEAGCEATPNRSCRVVEEFGGRHYRLVEQLEIEDARLVYAPPDAVGMFGGEVDNWMWPRHSGDFAFVRAYVGADQTPAPPDQANVPYAPARSLKMTDAGVSPGDAVMLPGYPAHTHRYRTTTESKYAALVRYPADIDLFSDVIGVIDARAKRSRAVARRTGVHRFMLANGLKNAQGMRDNFGRGSLVVQRSNDEALLDEWVQAKKKRAATYGPQLDELKELVSKRLLDQRRYRLISFTSWMPQLLAATRAGYRLALEREKPPSEQMRDYQDSDVRRIRGQLIRMQKTIHPATERDVLKVVVKHMRALPDGRRAVPFDTWFEEAGGPAAGFKALFDDPKWLHAKERVGLLTMSREEYESSKDPWISLAVGIEQWLDAQRDTDDAYSGAMVRLRPQYIEAFNKARDARPYPDANGTARISFGRVEGYQPRDAVTFGPQTTVMGMAERHGPEPFDLPDDLLLAARNAGTDDPRADEDLGDVPVCFLASTENTGGNSGSPVLNARGEVVGVAFDRNYEGMAADWLFETERTRSIQVDTRFILWMLDQTDGATALLREIGLGGAAGE